MKPEAYRKCTDLAAQIVITLAFICVFCLALMVTLGGGPPFILEIIVLTAFGFFIISKGSAYRLSPAALEIARPLGTLTILTPSIIKIEKRRRSRASRETVRIFYRTGGATRRIDLKPLDPAEFVSALRPNCPHLSTSRRSKIKRDASFRPAIETMHGPPRRRVPEESW